MENIVNCELSIVNYRHNFLLPDTFLNFLGISVESLCYPEMHGGGSDTSATLSTGIHGVFIFFLCVSPYFLRETPCNLCISVQSKLGSTEPPGLSRTQV
jgi:hypothetical protein